MEDTTKCPCVMVIDSVFARMSFPKSDPLGQALSAGFEPVGPCQIVGVVGHVKHRGLGRSTQYTQNQMYFPLYQEPDQWGGVRLCRPDGSRSYAAGLLNNDAGNQSSRLRSK